MQGEQLMGRLFFKQPNGLITIYSTITDGPIYSNVDKEGYMELMLEEYKKQLEQEAKDIFDKKDPYLVRPFSEMTDRIINGYKTKEDFQDYLDRVGYRGSIDDFKHLNNK